MVGQPNRRGWGRIRKLPSKRWQANYVGPDLARHNAPHTFTAKMDAERWLSDERRSIERDEWTPPAARRAVAKAKGVTLVEYASTWLAQRRLKHRTKAHYEALIRNHITPRLGVVALRNLTPAAVRSWYAALNPAHRTANSHAYSLLHGICATAVGDGLLTDNPCQIKRAMNTPRQRQPVILTVAEMAALAEAIEPQRLRALVLISAWCGLRWGEVIELRRKDVSVDASVLSVGRGATHRGGCRIDTPKSGKPRTVVVPPHIRADLKDHLDAFTDLDAEDLLFAPARGGCHLNDKVFRDYLAPALKSIGREEVRVHDLRHFCGTQTARVASLAESMERLGHSTVSASLLYQSAASGRAVEVAEALSKLAEETDGL